MKMKKMAAIISISQVEIICPACKEAQGNPVNGSFLWDMSMKAPTEMRCQSCCATITLKARFARVDWA